MLTGSRTTIERARKLRRTLSLPEGLLWRALRARPGGFKFRRQHPAGPYALDFFCAEAGLAIEIDGESHSFGDRPQRDAGRDDWLAGHKIVVLRTPARDVLQDEMAAVEHIMQAVASRIPLHHPLDGPPPRTGEEL
ncbi:endonuclease domain-containing protein [Sphingomonas sp. SRS2]|uniref:endonuclease domain-containing protein n=1 Tax=Sphingomonas sp. SRS2 TaxID=133190 RepID=UPI0006184690|nr:DUF559 domain-containing protein [Sphingomonas sp. SRS2]KKC24953.1 hypothetical protein WP12_17205 [Sphingomonas sp. SRS2]